MHTGCGCACSPQSSRVPPWPSFPPPSSSAPPPPAPLRRASAPGAHSRTPACAADLASLRPAGT
eukprot:2451766-Rhodomonas_salina.1